jgi:hypothetical protein
MTAQRETSLRGHRPLTAIEVQLVMQMCDRTSLLRLARCNRALMQDASHPFAWKDRQSTRLEWVDVQPNPRAIVRVLSRCMGWLLGRWWCVSSCGAATPTRLTQSVMRYAPMGAIVMDAHLAHLQLDSAMSFVRHICVYESAYETTVQNLGHFYRLSELHIRNMLSIELDGMFTCHDMEDLRALAACNPQLQSLTITFHKTRRDAGIVFPNLTLLTVFFSSDENLGVIRWLASMQTRLPKLERLRLSVTGDEIGQIARQLELTHVWGNISSLVITHVPDWQLVMALVKCLPRLCKLDLYLDTLEALLLLPPQSQLHAAFAFRKRIAVCLHAPQKQWVAMGSLLHDEIAHSLCLFKHDCDPTQRFQLSVVDWNGNRIF